MTLETGRVGLLSSLGELRAAGYTHTGYNPVRFVLLTLNFHMRLFPFACVDTGMN